MSGLDEKMNIRLQKYRDLMEKLPCIAAERALTRDWDKHPMFGIDSPHNKDKWAKAYHETSTLADGIFKQILAEVSGLDEGIVKGDEVL